MLKIPPFIQLRFWFKHIHMYIISSKSQNSHTYTQYSLGFERKHTHHFETLYACPTPVFGRRGIKLHDILSKYQFIKSKMQPYNLKRLPTEAKFTSNESRSVTKCKRPNYSLSIHLKEEN